MLKRISYTQAEVGMMNDLRKYMQQQVDAIPQVDTVSTHIRDSLTVKLDNLKQLLNSGVIEHGHST